MKNKLKKGLLLAGVSACLLFLISGCTSPEDSKEAVETSTDSVQVSTTQEFSLEDFESIEIGTKQADVHEKFGEPEGTLSGLYGDIYTIDDKRVIIYYTFDPDGGHSVSEVKITNR